MITTKKLFLRLFIILISIIFGACNGYLVENGKVYYKSSNEAQGIVKRHLKNADASTFEILQNDDYARDKNFVFYQGNRVEGADPSTFEYVADLYAKDKNRAYYAGDSIESSSSKGFKIIDSYYSADNTDVYYTTKPLKVCSVSNFKIFENDNNRSKYQRWSTDGCFYYFMNFKIPSNDYINVQYLKETAGFAKDKMWVYFLDRKINYNDSGKQIIDTVDVASFTVTDYIDCKDKYGCINVFHGREECR